MEVAYPGTLNRHSARPSATGPSGELRTVRPRKGRRLVTRICYLFLTIYLWAFATVSVQAQVTESVIAAPSLSGNLVGDRAQVSVLTYLPPGYATEKTTRYPVVYLLHSYGASNRTWLGEAGYEGMDLSLVLDSLIRSFAIGPLIVVMPDAHNRFGGSWYTDSPATGNWEQFIARDLVAFVDGKYRTVADRRSRGIAGQSMGGYGALRIALHHHDVFGAVLGMSATNLVHPDPLGPAAHEAALSIDGSQLSDVPIFGRVIWSKAAAFSPNSTAPPLYADLPFRRSETGLVRREAVWARWQSNTIVNQLNTAADDVDLRIRLDVGNRDPLRRESVELAGALAERELPFTMEIFDGDHVVGVRHQFETTVFEFFDGVFNGRP